MTDTTRTPHEMQLTAHRSGFGDVGEGGFGQIGSPLETTTTNLDSYNLPIIKDWGEYYVMRSIPPESPVALLLHFPLTLFYGLQKFAKVQLEVARMLKKRCEDARNEAKT